MIRNHDLWELVDICADAGITGTSAAKRQDFQRMLADCRKGKIDKILVKSISRFARNSMECLEIIRELKALGISVFFEEHNIDTKMLSSEILTAVIAACAQAESESISGNMKWSVQKRMQEGKFNTCRAGAGFYLTKEGMAIQAGAEPVIQILQGISYHGRAASAAGDYGCRQFGNVTQRRNYTRDCGNSPIIIPTTGRKVAGRNKESH